MPTDLLEDGKDDKDKEEFIDIDSSAATSDEVDEDEDDYGGSDPIMTDADFAGEELSFLCGSEEELKSGITTVVQGSIPLSWWDKYGEESLRVYVCASIADEQPAAVDWDNIEWNNENWHRVEQFLIDSGKLEHIKIACDIIVHENEPSGYSWEYNDGSYDRRSGYDKRADVIAIEISRPSAHELVCARLEIKKWKGKFTKKLINNLIS